MLIRDNNCDYLMPTMGQKYDIPCHLNFTTTLGGRYVSVLQRRKLRLRDAH